jgi:hypothetical protein
MQASPAAAVGSGRGVGGDTGKATREACQRALQEMDANVLAFVSQMRQDPAAAQIPMSFFEGASKLQLFFERPQAAASADTSAATREVRLFRWDHAFFSLPAALASEFVTVCLCG